MVRGGPQIELVGVAEISELLGVEPATVTKWAQRGILPEPDLVLSIGKIWIVETVIEWARETGRAPPEGVDDPY